MPDQSNQQTWSPTTPRRYVRLDVLGQPCPAPELVRCVGELPPHFSWADSFARPLYRAALREMFDAALRRAKDRHNRAITRAEIGRALIQTDNWFLRWEHILEHEAKQHDIYEP